MKRQRVTKRKLFLKYAVTYVTIVCVLFCSSIILHNTLFDNGKQHELVKARDRLDNAIHLFAQKMLSLRDASSLLNIDSDYIQLLLLKDTPGASAVPNVIAVQKTLRQMKTSQTDEVVACYIAFVNTPLFVGNFAIANRYADAYGTSIAYEGVDAETWRALCLHKSDVMEFLPATRVRLEYSTQLTNRSVMSCMVPLWADATYVGRMVFLIDMDAFLRSALPDALLSQCPMRLTSSDGRVLWRNGAAEETEKIAGTRIASASSALGVELRVDYADALVLDAIGDTLKISQWYMYISLVLAVLLALSYTYARFRHIIRLLEVSSIDLSSGEMTGNEYEYLSNAIREMSSANTQFREKIAVLQREYMRNLLEDACLRGVYEPDSRKLLGDFFGPCDSFTVAVLLRLGVDRGMPDAATLRVRELFSQSFGGGAVSMLAERGALVFLVPFASVEDVASALQRAVALISANGVATAYGGVSSAFSRIEDAYGAYEEAAYAAQLCARRRERVLAFDPLSAPMSARIPDIGLLTRLKELMHAGDAEEADALIGRVETETTESRASLMQTYYALRMVVESAWQRFLPGEAFAPNELSIDDIRSCARKICGAVNEEKNHERGDMRRAIYDYIEQAYDDPSLSGSTIAEHFMLSDRYIYRFVKEHTGVSLADLIERTRIRHAETYLKETDWSNEEIARRTGFGSINTFYRAFKKYHSVSPALWRTACAQGE